MKKRGGGGFAGRGGDLAVDRGQMVAGTRRHALTTSATALAGWAAWALTSRSLAGVPPAPAVRAAPARCPRCPRSPTKGKGRGARRRHPARSQHPLHFTPTSVPASIAIDFTLCIVKDSRRLNVNRVAGHIHHHPKPSNPGQHSRHPCHPPNPTPTSDDPPGGHPSHRHKTCVVPPSSSPSLPVVEDTGKFHSSGIQLRVHLHISAI